MSNIEIAQARLLRTKADVIIKSLVLSRKQKNAVNTAIREVTMPFAKYYKVSDDEIKREFIRLVIGGVVNKVDESIKEKIERCLRKKL